MRRYIYVFLFIITVAFSYGQEENNKNKVIKVDHSHQDWFLLLQQEVPNYLDVQKAYDTYFDSHPFEKSTQRNMVRRWLNTMASQQDENGDVYPYHLTIEDYKQLKQAEEEALRRIRRNHASRSSQVTNPPNATWNDSVGTWRMIGPYHTRILSGHRMHGGFNDRVYVNRFNTLNMFAGQSYGGLWVTKDGGATWRLTDAEFPNGKNTYANRDMYYGEIEVHPMDANRILVGSEAGLMVSTNGGDSWNLVDSLNYLKLPSERAYFVAQKPDDPNVILCSYGKKIYRTTNGGSTWNVVFDNSMVTHVYSTNQHSTIGLYQRWYNFAGLEFNLANPNLVILSAMNSNKELCIYKSSDAGQTFNLVNNTGNTKWRKMLTTPDDIAHIYLANIMTNFKNPANGEGIYKYDTSGVFVSYTPYPGVPAANLLDDIAVSQTDASHWVAGGYATGNVSVSNDSGATWTSYNATNNTYVHADVRSLFVVGDTVLVGTDGGIHVSWDGGETFNIGSQWISGIDLWGFASAFKGDLIAAGDDHGPTEFRIADVDHGWHLVGGADSHEVHINQCDQNYAYGADVYTPFRSNKINDSTFVRGTNAIPRTDYDYLAQDPDECYKFYPVYQNTLRYSQDNMTTNTILKTFSNEVNKAEVVLKNNKMIYLLENNRIVHKSIDGGQTFSVITPSASVTGGQVIITDIETDEYGDNVWLSYGQNQSVCKVVYSSNGGSSWTNITANLPNMAAEHVTYQRGTDGLVYLGLKPGSVWYKSFNDPNWQMLGSGLPMIGYITTMYTVPDRNKFRMGTSRGAFEHDLVQPSNVLAHFSVSSRTTMACELDSIQFFDYSSYHGTDATFLWTFEGGIPATSTEMNPMVTYPEHGLFDVTLTVTDANGNTSSATRHDFIEVVIDEQCGPQNLPSMAMFNVVQDKYFSAPSMGLTNTQTYTMMAWVKGEGVQVDYAGILSHKLSNGSIHLNVRNVGQDSTQLGYHHPNGQWWWNSGHYLRPNEWTHLALVVEPTGITLYKNGKPSKHNLSIAPADLTETFAAGTMLGATYYRTFKGYIDEIAFYKRSLTKEEIRTMMHLTKLNSKYPDQHDNDLLAYYQFNKDGPQVSDVTGNGRTGHITSGVTLLMSDGPYGGGRSQLINIAAPGEASFNDPGVDITFSTPHPNGQVVVSHIENLPSLVPSGVVMHEDKYYIINNYGSNQTFGPLVSLALSKTGTVSDEIAANGASFEFWKRPSNEHDEPFTSVITNNIVASAGNLGQITATDASPINSFSQFIVTRDNYPRGDAKVKIVPAGMENLQIEGGESVSLWIDSDNQGFGLPVLSDIQVGALGQPIDGMIFYHADSAAIYLYASNSWQVLKHTPTFIEPNSTAISNIGMVLGPPSIISSNAILKVNEEGFIRFLPVDNAGLTQIKYPTKGQLVFNTSSNHLQVFDGSNWSDLDHKLSFLPVSTATAPLKKGIVIGEGAPINNAVLQDTDPLGGILLPTLDARSIAVPTLGLIIFDTVSENIMFYNGTTWNSLDLK